MSPFDNFFAYSLAGGIATSPTQPTDPGTNPEPAVPTQWDAATAGTNLTLSNNNLTVTTTGNAGNSIRSNTAIAGKNYWEITVESSSGIGGQLYGISLGSLSPTQAPGSEGSGYSFYPYNSKIYSNGNGAAGGSNYASSATSGDIIGIAFDSNNGTLEFFKNGASLGIAFTDIPAGTYYAVVGHDSSGNTHTSTAKFNNFTYTPPAGYTAIGAEPENPGTDPGTTAWTPSELTNLAIWLDAQDETTITKDASNLVSQWSDKSSNNRNVIQDTNTAKPNYDTTTKSLVFNGSHFLTGGDILNILQLETVFFIVCKRNSEVGYLLAKSVATAANNRYGLGNYDNTTQFGSIFVPNSGNAGGTTTTANVPFNASQIVSVSYSKINSAHKILLNASLANSAVISDWTGDINSNYRFLIGAYNNISDSSQISYLSGNINEILCVQSPSAILEDDIKKIEGYLAHKWNLTANLPANHPYKITAPTV